MLAAKGGVSFLPVCMEHELRTAALNKFYQCMTAGTMANQDDIFRPRKPGEKLVQRAKKNKEVPLTVNSYPIGM